MTNKLRQKQKKETDVRPLGMDRGRIGIAADFDAPLPIDILAQFFGSATRRKDVSAKKETVATRRKRGLRKRRKI
jgi:hypothetical protein